MPVRGVAGGVGGLGGPKVGGLCLKGWRGGALVEQEGGLGGCGVLVEQEGGLRQAGSRPHTPFGGPRQASACSEDAPMRHTFNIYLFCFI